MTGWLIDKSALWKLPQSPDYEVWLDRINRGKVWAGLPTKLEVGVSAQQVRLNSSSAASSHHHSDGLRLN